jgi:hypothetical protein
MLIALALSNPCGNLRVCCHLDRPSRRVRRQIRSQLRRPRKVKSSLVDVAVRTLVALWSISFVTIVSVSERMLEFTTK